ncbi:MAG: hypothetical protein WBV61_06950 [Rhodanobacteraceae bacterium]
MTAPQYWHAKIAARIRAGGEAKVIMRDGFYENIVVRVESEAPVRIKVTPSKAELASVPRRGSSVGHQGTSSDASATEGFTSAKTSPSDQGPRAPQPGLNETASRNAEGSNIETIRQRLRTNLNHGRPVDGTMRAAQLTSGDVVFVDGSVRAVVRREGLNPQFYWLEGDLDLARAELKPIGGNRYEVLGTLRPGNYSLREAKSTAPLIFTASTPPAESAVRASLQRRYNEGRRIDEVLVPASLRHGDLIYTGAGAAVIVRRNGANLLRYWLNGPIDLNQPGLRKEGSNEFRLVGLQR